MNLLRGLLFDNLGLKLVALLMAVIVYLNVFTDRPATMLVSFPVTFDELADSLSLSGPVPGVVQAELRGTGKQLIRLRLTEPRLRISLAGAGAGRFERAISEEDLPLGSEEGIKVERLVGPATLDLKIERESHRIVPVRAQVEGAPAVGLHWTGETTMSPAVVQVRGPRSAIAGLDTVLLAPIRIEGRRDTVRAQVTPATLPDWCTMDPPVVGVTVPIVRGR
jgi:hypothetical protein